jgi:hypothetical protein
MKVSHQENDGLPDATKTVELVKVVENETGNGLEQGKYGGVKGCQAMS